MRLPTSTTRASTGYQDMPFSHLLFRYLWPFWLFRDASHGDRLTRAAAYRHNRGMRVHLPGYLIKWCISGAVAFAMTDRLAVLARGHDNVNIFAVMAAGAGMLFAGAICVLFVIAYVYCYLCRNDV